MNHTNPMESLTNNETLIDLQTKIANALQVKVLTAINQGKEYRRDLESVGFSIELLDRLSRTKTDSYEPTLYGISRGY